MTATQTRHVRTPGYPGNARGTALTVIGKATMPDGALAFVRCVKGHLPANVEDFRGMTVFDVLPVDLIGFVEESNG